MIACLCFCTACVNVGPKPVPGVTPEPTPAPTEYVPEITEDPVLPITTDSTEPPADDVDALGNPITGSDHFIRYLTFKNVAVYEEEGDTFLDGVMENGYTLPITCAVDAVYFDDDGNEIARARLQTRDGKYLLVLAPGDTVVLARIQSDITLTERDLTFEFDKETGIVPQKP